MTLTGSDYLLGLSALAVSFVGFSAVIVALRRALGAELPGYITRMERSSRNIKDIVESEVWQQCAERWRTPYHLYCLPNIAFPF